MSNEIVIVLSALVSVNIVITSFLIRMFLKQNETLMYLLKRGY